MIKSRKNYIDYLRVLSCLAVIMIHVFVTARTDFPHHTQFEEILCMVIPKLLHFSVPIFFMITGFLFLTKDELPNLLSFFKKYVLRYVIAIISFGYAFAIIESVFNKNYSLIMPVTAFIDTLQGKTWAHMWYLYSLVGVMLFVPILKVLLDKDEKYLIYIAIILFFSSFVNIIFVKLLNFKFGFDFIIVSPYLLYAIMGYFLGIGSFSLSKYKSYILIILCGFIITITEIFGVVSDNKIIQNLAIFGSYDSIIILVLAVSIFNLFKLIRKKNRFVELIVPKTYGIYIIHMFWINIIYKFFKFNIFGQFLFCKVLFVFFTVFILSYFSVYLLKKIPLMKNII